MLKRKGGTSERRMLNLHTKTMEHDFTEVETKKKKIKSEIGNYINCVS